MSSLGEIPWINKKIDDSPLETIKLLFRLITEETGRFNRRKLKSFTGFHFDPENMEMKIAQVAEDFCICKLKTISSLLLLEDLDTGREMAESICVFLNDVSKLQDQLLEYVEFKGAKSETKTFKKSNQLRQRLGQSTTSLKGNNESNTVANLSLKAGDHADSTCNQDSGERNELHCSQLTSIPLDSRKLGDSLIPAFTINIKLEDLGCIVEAILDTGSPISFLSYSAVPKTTQFESYDNRHQFRGITGTKINIIGQLKQMVVTQECEKMVSFYVVPNGILSSSCLLGRDYISQIELTLNGGIAIISDKID